MECLMSRLLGAAVLLALVAGCATAKTEATAEPAVTYTVVEQDASIPFANTVRGFRVGKDEQRSLLIEGGDGNWYRAELRDHCRRYLPWENAIGLDTGPLNRFDKFSTVIVDGVRCQVVRVDEIADPDAPAQPAAQPAT
jgi:hypothetical protein